MGRNELGELSGICGYAKVKYNERVAVRRRRRSSSEPTAAATMLASGRTPHPYSKLHKAPTLQNLYDRPRNRLQKRSVTYAPSATHQLPVLLYILEYDPYPYNTQPSKFLGVYSSINTVTAGAFRHGAYAFSREGVWDGTEYLSPTGRIKILSQAVQRRGMRATVPGEGRSKSMYGEPVRLDIPHPSASQEDVGCRAVEEREVVFLAVHEGPRGAVCIGVFADKAVAWGACLKSKAACAVMGTLRDEEQCIVEENMPKVVARVVGSGNHAWFVQVHGIDSSSL